MAPPDPSWRHHQQCIWAARLLVYSLEADNVPFEPDTSNCGREQSWTVTAGDRQRASASMTSGLLPGGSKGTQCHSWFPGQAGPLWDKVMITIGSHLQSLLYRPVTQTSALHCLISFSQHQEKLSILIPSIQIGELKLQMMRWFAWRHTTGLELYPRQPVPKPVLHPHVVSSLEKMAVGA